MDITPAIKKFLDISTAHMTPEDNKILSHWDAYPHDEMNTPVLVDSEVYGYRVYPDVHVLTSDGVSTLKRLGLSDQFVTIIALAIKHDCYFVNFDNAGCVLDGLTEFDW